MKFKGWNAPQVEEFTTDWGKRWEYVLDLAQSQGVRYLRVEPRVKFLGGPSVWDEEEKAVYRWMAQGLAERKLIPLITLLSFVPSANANWGNAGASQSFTNASGAAIDTQFWDGLITQHGLFLEEFRDAYEAAGGHWHKVLVQAENEPGNSTTGVIDPGYNDWMDIIVPWLKERAQTVVSTSYWGGTTTFVQNQADSLSGDWLDLIDFWAINHYTATGISYAGRWGQSNVNTLAGKEAILRAKFGKRGILTENGANGLAIGSRPSHWNEGLRKLMNSGKVHMAGAMNYIPVGNSGNADTYEWVDWNDSVITSLQAPTIPGLS